MGGNDVEGIGTEFGLGGNKMGLVCMGRDGRCMIIGNVGTPPPDKHMTHIS